MRSPEEVEFRRVSRWEGLLEPTSPTPFLGESSCVGTTPMSNPQVYDQLGSPKKGTKEL